MSEIFTRIRTPGSRGGDTGYMDRGEQSRSDMVRIIRARARNLRTAADAIDAISDADFEIDVVRGAIVQRHIRRVP